MKVRRPVPWLAGWLASGLLMLTGSPALAEWVKVSSTERAVIYLDPAVSKKVGNNVMVWMLRDFKSVQYDGAHNYFSSKDQIEVDCYRRKIRRIYSSNHPKKMGEGDFVSSEHGPMSWNDTSADTSMRRLVSIACLNASQ